MIDPPDVTPAHIRQFIGHCYTGRLGTGNRALSVLREAFDIGLGQGLCDFNPASHVKRKKQPKRTRRLTDAEFKGIRQCVKKWASNRLVVILRARQAVQLFYSSTPVQVSV